MPTQNKKKKRLKFRLSDIRKVFTLNIGTILFGALFIYMLISIVLYLSATHITSYQVTEGPLSKNQTYQALAIRSEQLVQSSTSGQVTYYARENSKVRKNGAIYGVGDGKAANSNTKLTDEQLSQIRSYMARFANSFDSDNFYDTYSFKYELEGSLLQYVAESQHNNIGMEEPDTVDGQAVIVPQTIGDDTVNFAPTDGILQFTKDGYENITEDNLTLDDFNPKSYQKENLRKDQVQAGEDIYKLITSEEWSLYIPLSDAQVVSLAGRKNIRVRFLKDGLTQTGKFTLLTKEDSYYAKITFTNGMVRYAADRFLEIELVTNTRTGLKIPLSSIVNKEFFIVPKGYETRGENSDTIGFLKEVKGKDGKATTEFFEATLYAEEDNFYYLDTENFKEGDIIVKPDSTERYTIRDTMPLEGVYSINKGYAVFRRVVIIDQNEEYCIVETGTNYGIAQFDNIVYDSSTVEEEEILY